MQQGMTYAIEPNSSQAPMIHRAALVQLLGLVVFVVLLGFPHHGAAMCPDHGPGIVASGWSQPASTDVAPTSQTPDSPFLSPVVIAAESSFCALCQAPFHTALLSLGALCFLLRIAQAGYCTNHAPQQPLILLATPPPR